MFTLFTEETLNHMQSTSSRPIAARVPASLYERLTTLASRLDRSKSYLLTRALQQYLESNEHPRDRSQRAQVKRTIQASKRRFKSER